MEHTEGKPHRQGRVSGVEAFVVDLIVEGGLGGEAGLAVGHEGLDGGLAGGWHGYTS